MRKEIDVTIDAPGRDQGKVFHLREMPAMQAEKWAMRALLTVARAGVDVPDTLSEDIAAGGWQVIAVMGVQAIMKLEFADAEPLLDEMMTCISFKPDPQNRTVERYLAPDDIEEVATIIRLRREVIELHMGFSTAGGTSKPISETPSPASSSSSIPTSQEPSVQFSRRAKRRSKT